MKHELITEEILLKAEFFDVDSMKIVWHGNYVKYYEMARCALLDKIGYGYIEMEASSYAWPIVAMEIKYIKPLAFGQKFRVQASLLEYENRIHIAYRINDALTGNLLNKGTSTQMAIDMTKGESLLVCPSCFTDKVKSILNSEKI